eukprot:778740-Pleurochrysis_carterae.AAC.3
MAGKSAVTKRDDMAMVGAPVKSPARGACQLEVKDSARSGLLAKASEALQQSPERAGEAGIAEETAIVEETVMSDAGEMENAGALVLILLPLTIKGHAADEAAEFAPYSSVESVSHPRNVARQSCRQDFSCSVQRSRLNRENGALAPRSSSPGDESGCDNRGPQPSAGQPSWQNKSTAQHHRAGVHSGRAGTAIRRSLAENLEDLLYQ